MVKVICNKADRFECPLKSACPHYFAHEKYNECGQSTCSYGKNNETRKTRCVSIESQQGQIIQNKIENIKFVGEIKIYLQTKDGEQFLIVVTNENQYTINKYGDIKDSKGNLINKNLAEFLFGLSIGM